ncbi:hypothetical protein ABIA32_001952 [Streptacidiphilus sp. MAP12-20]|uniref:hypothetical protein n=1 Tax=Streptacidiphilus sp. MAP12-20 TaxID=3156299 RepID=UPI003516626B
MIALTLRVLAPFLVVGALVLLLRWTFSRGRHNVAQRTTRRGDPGEYGLLVPVAAPTDSAEALAQGARLDEAGIRYTVVDTKSGPRLMVWEDDADRARALLR